MARRYAASLVTGGPLPCHRAGLIRSVSQAESHRADGSRFGIPIKLREVRARAPLPAPSRGVWLGVEAPLRVAPQSDG